MVPSRDRSQCCYIVNWNLERKHQWNLCRFHRRMKILSQESLFPNAIRNVFVALARPHSQCVIGHVMKKVISLMRSFKCRYIKSYIYKPLTHWGRLTHICVSNLAIIGSDNGLSSGRRQAIILTKAGILLIGPLGTNYSDILIEIHTFSFKKIHLKMSSGKWRPFCRGLNVLRYVLQGLVWYPYYFELVL